MSDLAEHPRVKRLAGLSLEGQYFQVWLLVMSLMTLTLSHTNCLDFLTADNQYNTIWESVHSIVFNRPSGGANSSRIVAESLAPVNAASSSNRVNVCSFNRATVLFPITKLV